MGFTDAQYEHAGRGLGDLQHPISDGLRTSHDSTPGRTRPSMIAARDAHARALVSVRDARKRARGDARRRRARAWARVGRDGRDD